MTPFHEILSRSVFLARERAGLTSSELSRLMDCDRGTISRIESGRAGCKLENALKIAQVCGVPFTELFGEFDSLTPTQERK